MCHQVVLGDGMCHQVVAGNSRWLVVTDYSGKIAVYPYLKALSVNELVDLMIIEADKLCEMSALYSPGVKLLAQLLGESVAQFYTTKRASHANLDSQVCLHSRHSYSETKKWVKFCSQ